MPDRHPVPLLAFPLATRVMGDRLQKRLGCLFVAIAVLLLWYIIITFVQYWIDPW